MNIRVIDDDINTRLERASERVRRPSDEALPVRYSKNAPKGFKTASNLNLVPILACDIDDPGNIDKSQPDIDAGRSPR
jgi:hypothetical protein